MLKIVNRVGIAFLLLVVGIAGLHIIGDIRNERAAKKCEDSGGFAERHGGSGDFVACLPGSFRPKP